MVGDFPILLRNKGKSEVYIPTRIRDEIKMLVKGTSNKTSSMRRLERQCERAYFKKPGFGYLGTKYVYQQKSDLLNRKIIYYKEPFEGIGRKMKCIGIDDSQDIDRAIFQDSLGQMTFNDEDLRKFGFEQILAE